MKIASATSLALIGMQRGMQGAQSSAETIASANQFQNKAPAAAIKALVDLKQNQVQVSASAKLFSIIDDTIGTLLDDEA
jgi:ABC-type transporter MlaC component